MLTSPEYIAAHLRDLAPEVGSKAEAIARHRHEAVALYRRERRHKLIRFAASIYRSIPFVSRVDDRKLAPTDSTPRAVLQ